MKTIFKVLYPLGFEKHEVADDFPLVLPFVEVPPISFDKKEDETEEEFSRRQQSQFFNFTENKWEEAVTQDYSKKLELIENLHAGLEVSNNELTKKTAEQDIQITDAQVALTELFEMVVG